MKATRWILPTLALAALLAGGCILISAQVLVSFNLPDPLTLTPTAIEGADVDLNTVAAYDDHKSDLKDVSDVAMLGEFTNTGTAAVDVDIWMTPELTDYTDAAAIVLDETAVKVWGPLRVPAGATVKLTWDQSVKLFARGRAALLGQIKGDGVFTLYAVGGTSSYSFRLNHGSLVAILDAGK